MCGDVICGTVAECEERSYEECDGFLTVALIISRG